MTDQNDNEVLLLDASLDNFTTKARKSSSLLLPLFFLAFLSSILTVVGSGDWFFSVPVSNYAAIILTLLLLIELIMSYSVWKEAIAQLISGQFTYEIIVLLCSLVTILDAFMNAGDHIPFCSVPAFAIWVVVCGVYQKNEAQRQLLKTLISEDTKYAFMVSPNAWNNLNCQFIAPVKSEYILDATLRPDYTQRILHYYVLISSVLAILSALLISLKLETSYIKNLSILLSAMLPIAVSLSFSRPYYRLMRKLKKEKQAICGWYGADALNNIDAILIADEDIAVPNSVTHSGIKTFHGYDPKLVISYAATIFRNEKSFMLKILDELLDQVHGRYLSCNDYRVYEGGGLGAEINGDIVLTGSLKFMRLMGVDIPTGTLVKSAVYISVNNELAAVIAVHFKAEKEVGQALKTLLAMKRCKTILASKNFLITPALIKNLYHINIDRLLYPSLQNRILISEIPTKSTPIPGAIMKCADLSTITKILRGGQQLYSSAKYNLWFCLLGGMIGFILMFYLLICNASASSNPCNLLLYSLCWLFPPLVLSTWIGHI